MQNKYETRRETLEKANEVTLFPSATLGRLWVWEVGSLNYSSTADLQREMMGLQREEQKLITDIKKAAKQNNTQAAKVLAKSLVRLRGQMNQLRASEAQLRGVKTTITVSICQLHDLRQNIQVF